MRVKNTGIENLLLVLTIGMVFPILLFLVGWWGSIPFVSEAQIKFFALGGLLTGILLDVLFLKRWMRNAFTNPLIFPALVYLFYSVCCFGFLMGVPVLNVLLGPVGGYYMGKRLRGQKVGEEVVSQVAHRTAIFTAFVLSVACSAALAMACLDQSLTANIQGIFRLLTPLSRELIMGLSAVAGVALVWLEYAVTRMVVYLGSIRD